MDKYETYLEKTGEIGQVAQVKRSVVYVTGLPGAKPRELVMTEQGAVGQVLSLTPEYVEVLVLSTLPINVGDEVARTDTVLTLPVGAELLGQVIDPLGRSLANSGEKLQTKIAQPVDVAPPGIDVRKNIDMFFETGVAMVDLAVPLGVGQRELIIGDRKIGKTSLLKVSMSSHCRRGGIGVYAAIAKRESEILSLVKYLEQQKITGRAVVVASSSADAPGMIFQTPYAAMTVAEYFRDQGEQVLVILDDLTIHAKYYREITLLAKRFPGRSAYPGDIFYVHSRLLERAGNFAKGSITALPVAETVLGDISGYIQTNLMSMTDGHVFFDQEYYNQGRRPAINPFLSVTRVGHQAQSPLYKTMSRELSSFLVHYEQVKQFMHFGGELSDQVKAELALGERITALFDQAGDQILPVNVAGVMLAGLWAGLWAEDNIGAFKQRVLHYLQRYEQEAEVKEYFNGLIAAANAFVQLVEFIKQQPDFFVGKEAGKE